MKFIDCHTHNRRWSEVLSIQNFRVGREIFEPDPTKSPRVSLGLHPWDIGENVESLLQDLDKLARNKEVVCIGEAGLDRAISVPLPLQHRVFEQQIVLSEMLRKPMIVHCVRAYNEIYRLRKQNNCQQNWMLHGFAASQGMTHQLLSLEGVFFSFGKAIFSNAHAHSFKDMPIDRVLLETDNEQDLSIEALYQKAAQVKSMPVEELAETIETNVARFFCGRSPF